MNSPDSHENNQHQLAVHLDRSETFHFQPLNKGFVFEEFIEGPTNKLAFETCKAIVDQLGDCKHNPLFLYGASGLGKTHLIQAVGHAVLDRLPDTTVMYLTAEQIVSEFTDASQLQEVGQFSKAYRNVDLLLIDDFNCLAGKSRNLDTFLKLIRDLLRESKQIIIASNLYPKEINQIDEGLLSQISSALSIAIEPPELENRVDILSRYSKMHGHELSRDGALCVAKQVVGNVGELEEALNQVITAAKVQGVEMSIELIKDVLKDQFALRAEQLSASSIQKFIAEYFRIPIYELIGRKRTYIYLRPRQMAIGLSSELSELSYADLGKVFGDRSKKSMEQACKRVNELCLIDTAFGEDYKRLLRVLR